MLRVSAHAAKQAASRNIPVGDVVAAAEERMAASHIAAAAADAAILVGYAEEGWQGGSNGNVVWAIVRAGELVTTMFRRATQPSTPAALRVATVIA